jgi:hypothetical protein
MLSFCYDKQFFNKRPNPHSRVAVKRHGPKIILIILSLFNDTLLTAILSYILMIHDVIITYNQRNGRSKINTKFTHLLYKLRYCLRFQRSLIRALSSECQHRIACTHRDALPVLAPACMFAVACCVMSSLPQMSLMRIHTNTHTYIHTYIHTYVRTYIHTYIHT